MIHLRKWSDKWYHNLIAISVENPLKTWWKARKYFKFPDIFVSLSSNKNIYPYATNKWRGKILDIEIQDLYWKDKWNSPRHERDPLIYICLFSKFSLWIGFTKYRIGEFGEKESASMEYWEYMLDYLYYSKTLSLDSFWQVDSKIAKITIPGNAEDGSEDTKKPLPIYIPTHLISLNKKGLKQFKKLYDKDI